MARIGVVLLALSAGCGGDEPPPDPVDAVRAAATGYVDALHRAEAWALADRALVLLDGRPLGVCVEDHADVAEAHVQVWAPAVLRDVADRRLVRRATPRAE